MGKEPFIVDPEEQVIKKSNVRIFHLLREEYQ